MTPEDAGLRQFRQDGRFSYCLYDRRSRRALLIDPCPEQVEEYRSFAAELGLRLALWAETRSSTDREAACRVLQAEPLGQVRALGDLPIEVIHSPGGAAGAVCLYAAGLLFVGDELAAEALAALTQRFSPETVVLPSSEREGLLFSTLKMENEKPKGTLAPGVAALGVEKFAKKLEERAAGSIFVDVREADEFAEGHIAGMVNFPLSELALHYRELARAGRIYLSCRSGRRSAQAAFTLGCLGLDAISITGGIQAWMQAGMSVKS